MCIQEDCIRTQIVTDAIELLEDGFPLDRHGYDWYMSDYNFYRRSKSLSALIPRETVKVGKILEKNKNVVASSEEGYKHYYSIEDIVGDIDNKILETRHKIYDLILKNPGLHQAKIAQILTMRKSLAEYHLQYLEKSKAIISVKEECYKSYYT